jgi:hypothetical protein
MFALKDESLLCFDERRCTQPESLHDVFGVREIGDAQGDWGRP